MGAAEQILSGLSRLVPAKVRDSAWLRPRLPLVALELREDAVIAVRLGNKRKQYELAGHGRRQLPADALVSGVMKLEINDREALKRAIQEALQMAGAANVTAVSLTLPDPVVRVFLVDVQELPASPALAAEMIRLRLKKSVPFRLDDTRLSWQALGRLEDGREQLLVALASDPALRPIESLLEELGIASGLIGIASFDLYNALRADKRLGAGRRGDLAIVNATSGYFSTTILRGERLIFYRSKNYHVQGGFQGEESLRVVGRELRSSLSYYQEHLLGEGIGTTLVRVSGLDAAAFLETARGAGCGEVREVAADEILPGFERLDPGTALELLPALGLVLRRDA